MGESQWYHQTLALLALPKGYNVVAGELYYLTVSQVLNIVEWGLPTHFQQVTAAKGIQFTRTVFNKIEKLLRPTQLEPYAWRWTWKALVRIASAYTPDDWQITTTWTGINADPEKVAKAALAYRTPLPSSEPYKFLTDLEKVSWSPGKGFNFAWKDPDKPPFTVMSTTYLLQQAPPWEPPGDRAPRNHLASWILPDPRAP